MSGMPKLPFQSLSRKRNGIGTQERQIVEFRGEASEEIRGEASVFKSSEEYISKCRVQRSISASRWVLDKCILELKNISFDFFGEFHTGSAAVVNDTAQTSKTHTHSNTAFVIGAGTLGAGTQFTCFTSRKVQILTLVEKYKY